MMSDTQRETLLLPHKATPSTAAVTRGLSTEILGQGAYRLRTLALIYSFTFFMASFPGRFLSAPDRMRMFENPLYWLPDALSIALGLVVAGSTLAKNVPLATTMGLGVVFLVVSSYGIAIAEYIDPFRLDNNGWMGFSWVAIWAPLYVVVVPTPPRKSVLALLLSLSAVPVTIGTMIAIGRTTFQPDASQFFFWVAFPYLLVMILGYVGARVVYDLGKQVTHEKELGSYRLVERLGQGGMGEVWRAKHRLLARPAAIKLIRPSMAHHGGDQQTLVRRFEREAQVTAQLRSPHTVELWDFGVSDDGSFYYVMELLDGLDLDALVKQYGPLPAERVVYLLRQVCHSLAEAEANGLVHRDIKPANVFVCRYGEDHDFVKVLDFGIVKATDTPTTATATLITGGDLVQGTPAFIAPEQALGAAGIDGRADIYATGCLAYWLLTGETVFTADSAVGMLMHHAYTIPVAPSQRSEQPIPPELDLLVMACLAKNPEERPQTAGELARRASNIPKLSNWSEERAREWWEVNRPLAGARSAASIVQPALS